MFRIGFNVMIVGNGTPGKQDHDRECCRFSASWPTVPALLVHKSPRPYHSQPGLHPRGNRRGGRVVECT